MHLPARASHRLRFDTHVALHGSMQEAYAPLILLSAQGQGRDDQLLTRKKKSLPFYTDRLHGSNPYCPRHATLQDLVHSSGE